MPTPDAQTAHARIGPAGAYGPQPRQALARAWHAIAACPAHSSGRQPITPPQPDQTTSTAAKVKVPQLSGYLLAGK